LLDTQGKTQTPWAGGGDTIRIDKLGKTAEAVEAEANIRLSLSLARHGARLQLSGHIDKRRVDVSLPEPTITFDSAWADLLRGERLLHAWDEEREALVVSFATTSEEERGSLVRDLVFRTPAVTGGGRFDASTVPEVPIYPPTRRDASEWAEWRLVRSIESYALSDRFETWKVEACAPFADLDPTVPDRVWILDELDGPSSGRRPDKKYWHVQAPLDWDL